MKFFNSSKKWRFASSSITKYILAALLSLAGVQGVLAQSFYVAGNGDSANRGSWCGGQSWNANYNQMTQEENLYFMTFASLPANNDYQFKIVQDGNWNSGSWGISNVYSYSDNTNMLSGTVNCTDGGEGNIKFSLSEEANVTIAFDFTNKRVAVYSSSVEIGLIGSFINNWNLEQQIMGTTGDGVSYTWDLSSSDISLNNSDEFKFISGTSWDNNNNQWGGPLGGAYTIPASASTDGTIYNVDIIVHHEDCGNVKFDAPLCPVTIQKIELNVLTNDLKITTRESSTEPDPVTPTADSYVVTWAEPVYEAEAGTVVLSATVAAAEDAGFALADGTFEAQINVVGLASSARTILSESNQYTISRTISGVAANQQIDYSLQIVTGEGSEIVSPSDVADINPQTYVVEEQGPTDLNLYVRGQNYNGWGYPGEDFKGVTTDGVIYTWDWALAPKEMSGPFKIAYCNINNPDNWNNDLNFGLENAATLTFGADGTWTGTLVKNESGDMTIAPARNVKKITFDYNTKELLIEAETSSSCQDLVDGFTISGQFNVEILDADGLYQGSPVVSDKEEDPADGYWSDGARYIQLTANSVTANYFDWECTGYAIDGTAQEAVPEISWTDKDKTSARAELSLPGTYTFVCKAKCNETDEWTISEELTITAPAPEMGFNGNIVTNHDWGNPEWAGEMDGGYMPRENGKLVWVSKPFTVDGFGTGNDNYHFVIDQRYKFLGCVKQNGWTENNECNDLPGDGNNKDNKINRSNLTFKNVAWDGEKGANFAAINPGAWVANETQLQLTVTMTGWDSYTVKLAKKQEQIFANYSSNAPTMGTVAMKVGDISIDHGADITVYIGQQVTLTAMPAQGYKVASWEINGKVTESDKTTIFPTLSGAGLIVVVTFERDCYSGIVYDLTGGGVICANGGSTELSLNTLNNVTYQLYKDDAVYDKADPVQGNGEAAKWTISEAGTYTAKSYDSRFEECQEQAIDMNGSADVTTVTAPEITVNPGKDVHLTVLQARSFTTEVPVDWSITDVSSEGGYCTGDGYMISSKTDTSLVAKFLCIGTAKITATMKAPNQNCKAEVTVHQNGAEMENCAPEPEDVQ